MANSAFRVSVLNGVLAEAGIPVDGISIVDIAPTPPVVTIQYTADATAEQIALGDQILAQFDWRKRRALARTTVVTALQQLTTAQQNAILRHVVCEIVRNQPALAAQIDAALGTSLPVDEVDPL
jgi:hypothetical protein